MHTARRGSGSGWGAAAHRCGNGGRRRGVDGRGSGRDGGAVGTRARRRSGRRWRARGGRDVGGAARRRRQHGERGGCRAGATRSRRLIGGACCQRFLNKQILQKKIAQNKYLGIDKNSGKFHGGRKLNLEHFSQLTLPPDLHGFWIISKIPSQI
jgi:hypothetical protein